MDREKGPKISLGKLGPFPFSESQAEAGSRCYFQDSASLPFT